MCKYMTLLSYLILHIAFICITYIIYYMSGMDNQWGKDNKTVKQLDIPLE